MGKDISAGFMLQFGVKRFVARLAVAMPSELMVQFNELHLDANALARVQSTYHNPKSMVKPRCCIIVIDAFENRVK